MTHLVAAQLLEVLGERLDVGLLAVHVRAQVGARLALWVWGCLQGLLCAQVMEGSPCMQAGKQE